MTTHTDEPKEDTEDYRAAMLDAMQEMVDWLRVNPQVPIPYGIGGSCFLTDEESRKGRRGTTGWNKSHSGNYIQYTRTWGPFGRVSFSIYVDKSTTSTCHQVQVGTRIVPAVEEHEEPVMKWICEPESKQGEVEPDIQATVTDVSASMSYHAGE